MKHYLAGVVILLVLSIALFLVETHRQWSLIVFLLALIFTPFLRTMESLEAAFGHLGEKKRPQRKSNGRNAEPAFQRGKFPLRRVYP